VAPARPTGGAPTATDLTVPSLAAAATPLASTTYRLTGTPLLLIHGYSDSCAAFTQHGVDLTDPGTSPSSTVAYLTSHHFDRKLIDLVGYYNHVWHSTFPSKGNQTIYYNDLAVTGTDTSVSPNVSVPPDCDHTVTAEAATGAPGSNCGPDYGTGGGYTWDPDLYLSCLLAWYIEDNYSSKGRPVNVLAHSMGGLLIRAALAFSGPANSPHHLTGFPTTSLLVDYVVTVATPQGGLSGPYAGTYKSGDGSQEIADMTVCPNQAASCTVTAPFISSQTLATSTFMKDLFGAGIPRGGSDALWMEMASATQEDVTNIDGGITSWLNVLGTPTQKYPDADFVVAGDSMVAMDADAKIYYGNVDLNNDLQQFKSGGPDYNHEANTCQNIKVPGPECTASPYYLNDATTGTTGAWYCAGNCTGGLDALIANAPVQRPYSLAQIVQWLLYPPVFQTGHAAHASNDYPYAGLGMYNQNEGIDAWTEYYGQCDGFGAWKAYENLGGTFRPAAASLPASGWQPSDAAISPIVSYAGLSSKAGTWGDARDWIRTDQGLHAAPYFGIAVDQLPRPGSFAVWSVGVFGHVAYVTDVIDANTIQIEDYNLHGAGLVTTDIVTRSGGFTDTSYGLTTSMPWPDDFVHLGDGAAGPAQALPAVNNSYPAGTYGPTSNSGGPSFTLTGAAYPNTVHGWYLDSSHGVLGWMLYTNTHVGAADSTATWSPTLPTANGCYRVDAFVPNNWSNSAYALYAVTDQKFGTSLIPVDENVWTNQYATLGVFQADSAGHLSVLLTDQGPPSGTHQVAADAMRYLPVSCSSTYRTALVIDAGTPGFSTSNVWYSEANHGVRGNERWTASNGISPLSTATYTPTLPVGCYVVAAFVPDYAADAPAALYTVNDGAFTTATLADADQSAVTNDFVTLGVFETRSNGTIAVTVTDQNPVGLYIAADAMKFMPANCSAVARDAVVVDPGTGSPDFTTAGPTFGNGDIHGWYHSVGGLRGNQYWTYANQTTTAQSTATYTPSGLGVAGGCYDVRAFIPDNHANNPQARYEVDVLGPTSGYGAGFPINQATPTNAWVDLGKYNVGASMYIDVIVNDVGPTGMGTLYTAADAIDFRTTTGCTQTV
jgi:surface antigen